MTSLFAGFALGLSLILAIGAQNSFVLRQGLKGEFVLPVVLTCAISDAVLIVAGVAGFGALVEAAPVVVDVARWGGISAQYPDPRLFGLGAVISSFFFFFSLGYGASLLRGFFASPLSWRILDVGIGITMWAIAYSLISGI